MNNIFTHKKMTASGVICDKPCVFGGFIIGTDDTNDPEITIYDNASAASGNEVVPTATYDASVMGLNGYTAPGMGIDLKNGAYIEITCAGTVEVTVFYKEKPFG